MKTSKKGSAGKRSTPLLLILSAAVALVAVCLLPLCSRLVVSNQRTGQTVLVLPIQKGETFLLRFRHSVNLSDVTDTIEWTGANLICRSTLFTAFGAGMPVLADGIGTDFTMTDEGFLITGIDKPETRILVMLQEVPNHRLILRGTEYSLFTRMGNGAIACIEVRPASLIEILLHSDITPHRA